MKFACDAVPPAFADECVNGGDHVLVAGVETCGLDLGELRFRVEIAFGIQGVMGGRVNGFAESKRFQDGLVDGDR